MVLRTWFIKFIFPSFSDFGSSVRASALTVMLGHREGKIAKAEVIVYLLWSYSCLLPDTAEVRMTGAIFQCLPIRNECVCERRGWHNFFLINNCSNNYS